MWRARKELAWMGSSFIALSCGITVQLATRDWPLVAHVLSFSACYLLATAASGQALAQRLQVHMPRGLAWLLVTVVVGAQIWFSAVDPNLPIRVAALSISALLLMGLPLLYWQRMQPRNRFDQLLRWVYVVCILTNIARTLLQLPQTEHASPSDFMGSTFWTVIQFFALVLGLSLAGCMFFAVLHDVLQQLHIDRNTDALTQLLNRRGWHARLEQLQKSEGSQAGQTHSLMLADIDHFKQINDSLGHAVGDEVLQQVARLFQQQVRGEDVVCRHGGEEFVVLLVNTPLAAGQQVAERIRQRIQQLPLPQLQGHVLTISIGVAQLEGLTTADVAHALTLADNQLYAAKHAGRNQVVIAQ